VEELTLDTFLVTLVYTFLGLLLFGLSLVVAAYLSPFSLKKEVEDDQNVAVGIIIGSMFIGIAIIVAASIT